MALFLLRAVVNKENGLRVIPVDAHVDSQKSSRHQKNSKRGTEMHDTYRSIAPLTYDKQNTGYLPAETAEKMPVMLVDDNRQILELLSESLTRYGYRVTRADDGFKALSVLDKEDFKLVVTDFHMPGMDGSTLASAIKKRHPGMVILLATGLGKEFLEEKRKLENIDLFIRKPFAMSTFLDIIGRIFKMRVTEDVEPPDNMAR